MSVAGSIVVALTTVRNDSENQFHSTDTQSKRKRGDSYIQVLGTQQQQLV